MDENSESPIESKKSKSKTPRKPKETVLKQSLSLSGTFTFHYLHFQLILF